MRLALLLLSFTFLLWPLKSNAQEGTTDSPSFGQFIDEYEKADSLFASEQYQSAIETYKHLIQTRVVDSLAIHMKLAKCYALLGDSKNACYHLDRHLQKKDPENRIWRIPEFDQIKNSKNFIEIVKKYCVKLTPWAMAFFYVGLIGLFLATIIVFNKRSDKIARLLISSLLFLYAFRTIQTALLISGYRYYVPHILLTSAPFSYLYGPIVYLYVKRVFKNYRLRLGDLLHLVPFLIYMGYLLEHYYLLSSNEKLLVMMNYGVVKIYKIEILLKIAAPLIYAILILDLLRRDVGRNKNENEKTKWVHLVAYFFLGYCVLYFLYLFIPTFLPNLVFKFTRFFTLSEAFVILYLGYLAYSQPLIFSGRYMVKDIVSLKYKKSGLTKRYSNELKEELTKIMMERKIYKNNDLNLDGLSDILNITRHHTSQVINEHFGLSFHEFVNKYRISEAKTILKDDTQENLNVVDIGFEVGYNSKSTFFSKFKEATGMTPSEYRKRAVDFNHS